MPSPEFTSEHRPMSPKDRGQYDHQDLTNTSSPAKPKLSYAKAARTPPTRQHTSHLSQTPTYRTEAQDLGFPHPINTILHLLIAGRYSTYILLPNELVFRYVFQLGHAATRELLQSWCAEAHRAVKNMLGANLQLTNAHRDTATVVTMKANTQQGTWTLLGDINVRFGNARAAIATCNQDRTQYHDKNTEA